MKKVLVLVLAAVFCASLSTFAVAAEKKETAKKEVKAATEIKGKIKKIEKIEKTKDCTVTITTGKEGKEEKSFKVAAEDVKELKDGDEVKVTLEKDVVKSITKAEKKKEGKSKK